MDVDQDAFSQQVVSLQNLVARFEGRIDEVSRNMEEVEAMEEAQVQARERLREKAHTTLLAHQRHGKPRSEAAQPPFQSTSQASALQYVGPTTPTDITMDEVLSYKGLKRRRQDKDVGTSSNPAQEHREMGLSEGVSGRNVSPTPSSTSSFFSAPSSPSRVRLRKGKGTIKPPKLGSSSTTKPARGAGHILNDESDYGSDTETVAALYENRQAPKDETITQVMTLLTVLVEKVNNLLDRLPPNPAPAPAPAPAPRSVHPIVSQHLVSSGQRRAPVPQGNFKPWDQNEDDDRPTCPVRRPVERVAALAYVRVAFAECLGRKSKKDPLPPSPPNDTEAPTRKEFWVRWLEPHNSEFNTTACGIVTRKIMEKFPTLFMEDCYDDLFKMVTAHMKYNIQLYRRQHLPAGDASEAQRLAAASSNRRRHTIFQKRMYITGAVKALRPHRRLLKDLGIDGTSSDEEDFETPGLYKVKRIKQLSSSVVQLKQKLDDTYETLVKAPGRKGSRGRKRVRTAESSSRKFRIKGLPVNCVNRIWYNRLSSAQKDVFRFADYEYNFKFPDEILNM